MKLHYIWFPEEPSVAHRYPASVRDFLFRSLALKNVRKAACGGDSVGPTAGC